MQTYEKIPSSGRASRRVFGQMRPGPRVRRSSRTTRAVTGLAAGVAPRSEPTALGVKGRMELWTES